jgi:hypothetical protein
MIKTADRATEFRIAGDHFADVGRPSYLSLGRDKRSRRASRIHPRIVLTSFKCPSARSEVATDNGLLRTMWTADEFKGQGGHGAAVTDVVGVAKDYDDEVDDIVVGFADRLDWDVDCERDVFSGKGRQTSLWSLW